MLLKDIISGEKLQPVIVFGIVTIPKIASKKGATKHLQWISAVSLKKLTRLEIVDVIIIMPCVGSWQ